MKRLSILAVTGAMALLLTAASRPSAAPSRPLDLYFIDVEGGAATLMVTPAGESVLVDTGWPGEHGRDAKRIEQVARYQAGLKQIDHLVVTHWHTDHYGGVAQLAKLMPIKHYYDHGIPAKCEDDSTDFNELMAAYKTATGGKSITLNPGDRIPLRQYGPTPLELRNLAARGKVVGEGSKELAVTCPRHTAAPTPDDSDNMRSLALLTHFGNFSFLNCGDLTWNIEHKLTCPKNRIGQVDLLQVTHHGWQASTSPALLDAIQPRCAVMVNGAHKGASPRVVKLLKSTKSLEALYQLHLALDSGPDENTSQDHIANIDEKCNANYFRVRVDPLARTYTIFKNSNKPLQTFVVR